MDPAESSSDSSELGISEPPSPRAMPTCSAAPIPKGMIPKYSTAPTPIRRHRDSSKERYGRIALGCFHLFIAFTVAFVIVVGFVGITANHRTLVELGNRLPIFKKIGELFHSKSGHDSSPLTTLREDWDWNQVGTSPDARMFTDEDIAFTEGAGQTPYLVILGNVFDVSSNYASYKSGTGYHGFIGQDGTRAFVSGDFTKEGLISNVDDLKPDDYLGLVKWLGFYYKTYPHAGYHIGRFYNKYGTETDYMQKVRTWVTSAEKIAAADNDLQKQFPACNMQWDGKTEVTQYWCSRKSGGIDREWEGYPHMFQEEEGKPFRCACIHTNHLKDPRVKPYENCPPRSERCQMHVPAQKNSGRVSDEL